MHNKPKSGKSSLAKQGKSDYQIARDNVLQSGLYFLLGMHSNQPYKQISEFFQDCAIKINHSRETNTKRAFYLNFALNEPDSYLSTMDFNLEQHLSVDCDYFDFEGLVDVNRIKLHYVHYTETYTSKNITENLTLKIHIYFNLNGTVVQNSITEFDGRTTNVELMELNLISENIKRAKIIINRLFAIKNEITQDAIAATRKAKQNLFNLIVSFAGDAKFDADSQQLLDATRDNYNQLNAISFALSDNLVLEKLEQSELDAIVTNILNKPAVNVNVDQMTTHVTEHALTVSLPNKSQAQIEAELVAKFDKNTRMTLAKKPRNLDVLAEIENVRTDGLMLQNEIKLPKQIKNLAKTMQLLEKIDLKLEVYGLLFQGGYEFIIRNIELLKEHLNARICECFIARAYTCNQPSRSEYINICEFLYEHNLPIYRITFQEIINRKCEDNGDSFAYDMLFQCIKNNRLDAFEMLLKHGLRLDAKGAMNQKDELKGYYSTIFNSLPSPYNVYLDENSNSEQAIADVAKFIEVTLRPEYYAGFEEKCSKEISDRSALIERLHNKRILDSMGKDGEAYTAAINMAKRKMPSKLIIPLVKIFNQKKRNFRFCQAILGHIFLDNDNKFSIVAKQFVVNSVNVKCFSLQLDYPNAVENTDFKSLLDVLKIKMVENINDYTDKERINLLEIRLKNLKDQQGEQCICCACKYNFADYFGCIIILSFMSSLRDITGYHNLIYRLLTQFIRYINFSLHQNPVSRETLSEIRDAYNYAYELGVKLHDVRKEFINNLLNSEHFATVGFEQGADLEKLRTEFMQTYAPPKFEKPQAKLTV